MNFPRLHFSFCAAALGAMALAGSTVWAADLSVQAAFSREVTGVGEPVQLQVTVNGTQRAEQPPEVAVDGLDIQYAGPSSNMSARFENGTFTQEQTVTYVYQVNPERGGTFTVPSLQVAAQGRILRTQPVVLKVEQGGGAAAAGGTQRLGFAEFTVPKKTAYLGETIPVELRLYVDAQAHWQPEAMPEITGEGFTKQKMPQPRQEQARKDGREYDVLVFRTAVTPGKAGKITLGPVELPYIAAVPRAQRNRPRSVFDLLDDPTFGGGMFAQNQRFKARADALEIEVKPLPAAGRPKNFSGAVGQFRLEAEGNPKRVKVGDPVTMKLTVSGRGNFDRIEAPALVDPQGWRTYPPSQSFKPDDELNLNGAKTFEIAVIPEMKKIALPVFEFSYFDPTAERYVTLKNEMVPLTVEGASLPEPPPVAAASEAGAAPTPAPLAAQPTDILGLRYDAGGGRRTFRPLYAQGEFLLVQLGPALLLLGLLGAKWQRREKQVDRAAHWRREKAALLSKWRAELPPEEFLATAVRLLQLETALATGADAASVAAAEARQARPLEPDTAEEIDRIFEAHTEYLYAGVGGAAAPLTAEDRQRIRAAVERFQHGHARV